MGIGLDKISITNAQLTVSIGTVYGAYFTGTITYQGSTNVVFQLTLIKDLHMAVWAGLTITYDAMLKSLESVITSQVATKPLLGEKPKKMLGIFKDVTFTMVLQNGDMDYTKTPELIPDMMRDHPQSPEKNLDKDKLYSEKAALILLGKVTFNKDAEAGLGSFLAKWGIGSSTLLAKIHTDEFYAEATLNEVQLSTGVTLKSPGLFVHLHYRSPQEVEFGIKAQIVVVLDSVPEKKLNFDGEIVFTPMDAGFRFAMHEIYIMPLGYQDCTSGDSCFNSNCPMLWESLTNLPLGEKWQSVTNATKARILLGKNIVYKLGPMWV